MNDDLGGVFEFDYKIQSWEVVELLGGLFRKYDLRIEMINGPEDKHVGRVRYVLRKGEVGRG